jgi:hypothetical protein
LEKTVLVANPWGNDKFGGVYGTYLTLGQFMSNFVAEESV